MRSYTTPRCLCGRLHQRQQHVQSPRLHSYGAAGAWLRSAPAQCQWRHATCMQRARVACRAKGDADGPALGLDALAPLTRTPLYRYGLQGAVVLVILGAVDAGWSGDWHRLGVLTTNQEATIRGLLVLLGCFHIGFAVVAAKAASSKGLNVAPAVAKVLAVGFLAMLETIYAEPNTAA